jgi:hypothetical protein
MSKRTKKASSELTDSRRQFLKLSTCAGALAVARPAFNSSAKAAHTAYQASASTPWTSTARPSTPSSS